MQYDTGEFCQKLQNGLQHSQRSGIFKLMITLHEDLYVCLHISLKIQQKKILDKSCREKFDIFYLQYTLSTSLTALEIITEKHWREYIFEL
jgi:hypothetical protein